MKILLSAPVILIAVLACSSNPKPDKPKIKKAAEPAPEVARTRVLSGPDGIRIEVVELEGGQEAFVKVSGTRHDIESKVLKYEVKENDQRTWLGFKTEIYGRTHTMLARETSRRSGPRWYLWIPETHYRDRIRLRYDEDAEEKVDTAAIFREYQEQSGDGTLAAIQNFSREREMKKAETDLQSQVSTMKNECGFSVPIKIAWKSVDDDTLKEHDMYDACYRPMYALRQICDSPAGKEFIDAKVKSVQCRIGDDTKMAVKGGKLVWTVAPGAKGDLSSIAREKLAAQKFRQKTVGFYFKMAKNTVCADEDKKRYIVMAPSSSENPGLYYGDGKEFYKARTNKWLGSDSFWEPRHYNERSNPNFRGYDVRVFSHVSKDKGGETCTLSCGTHKTKFKLLTGDDAAKIVAGTGNLKPDPHPFTPYALARDRRGKYYYVDRSTKPGQERFFRLFIGKVGNLKKQRMRDIVSDSEGEIFSSKAGDLRLILGKEDQAVWITRKKERKLKRVPVERNLQLIYTKLGVYDGQMLGNPCDDYGVQ